jgi:antitoxin component YwqK of YwqJK toxin-antitoxin module
MSIKNFTTIKYYKNGQISSEEHWFLEEVSDANKSDLKKPEDDLEPFGESDYDGFHAIYGIEYHDNGQVESQGCSCGYDVKFNQNGTKTYERTQLSNLTLQLTTWYENGTKRSKGNTDEDSKRYGKWSFWHNNGNLACVIDNMFGKESLVTIWDKDGNEIQHSNYSHKDSFGQQVFAKLISKSYPKPLVDKYRDLIFHGHDWQG